MRLAKLVACFAVCAAVTAAPAAFGQSGVRIPERGEPGLDPSFARGWLAPGYDRFGFAYYAPYQWREAAGFMPGSRMRWSYDFSERGSLGMGVANGMYLEQDRPVSRFGRYLFSPLWSLTPEQSRHNAGGLPPRARLRRRPPC